MKRLPGLLVLLLTVSVLSGCSDRYEKNRAVFQKMASAMEDFLTAVESAKDTESSKAAAEKINNVSDRLEGMMEEVRNVPKVTVSEKEKLDKEFNPKLEALGQRFAQFSENQEEFEPSPEFEAAVLRFMTTIGKLQVAAQQAGAN